MLNDKVDISTGSNKIRRIQNIIYRGKRRATELKYSLCSKWYEFDNNSSDF